jgi:uncharacterized repeat protein (TIGR01451 family)
MKKSFLIKSALVLILFFSFYAAVFSAAPRIVSVTMVPPSPSFGDAVAITVVMCGEISNDNGVLIAISSFATRQPTGSGGQVFVVDYNDIDVDDVNMPSSGIISYDMQPAGGTSDGCTNCGSDASKQTTMTFNVHIPDSSYYSSCNPASLYVQVGAKDAGVYAGDDWAKNLTACQTASLAFPIGTPASSFNIAKRYEGVLQNDGDKVLFAIDYNYANGSAFTITDVMPTPPAGATSYTLLSYGPTTIPGVGGSVSAPTIGATSGTFIWTFPGRVGSPGRSEGTVWMLLQMNGTPAAGNISINTVTATMKDNSGAAMTPKSASAPVIAGQPAITITKDESATTVNYKDNITYTLSYEVNGMALRNFQAFDDSTTGVYAHPGAAPTGWRFASQGGAWGTWTVSDPCSTGGHYITGAEPGGFYPGLLLDDGSGTNNSDQFCTGEIVADEFINPGTFAGADAQIIIRSNGIDGPTGASIGIVTSIDANPAPGYFFYQYCPPGGGACTYAPGGSGGLPHIGAPSANKWYRVRILVTEPGGACTAQRIQAKIWARGDPEPTTWDIDYTDPNLALAAFQCDASCAGKTSSDWRPGVNEQPGTTNDVQDAYDNFTTYELRSLSGTAATYDTVPTEVKYLSCNGCANGGPVVKWNIGAVSNTSGSFTWWGQVTGCDPISNQGFIVNASVPIFSNWVTAVPICEEVTGLTKTANKTSVGHGETIVWTITYCNDGIGTIPNYTIWDTVPAGITYNSCTGGTCSHSGGTPDVVTWTIGDLLSGQCNLTVSWTGTVQ